MSKLIEELGDDGDFSIVDRIDPIGDYGCNHEELHLLLFFTISKSGITIHSTFVSIDRSKQQAQHSLPEQIFKIKVYFFYQ